MRALLRSQLFLQLANASCVAIALAWVLLAGRWLGPRDANAFFAALALATIAQSATGGFRAALGRHCAWLRDDPASVTAVVLRAEHTLLHWGVPLGLGCAGALAVGGDGIGMSHATAIAVVAVVMTRLLLETTRAGIAGRGSFAALARNQLLEATARIGIGIACMLVMPNATSAIAAYACGSVIAWRAGRRVLGHAHAPSRPHADAKAWTALPALVAWNLLVAASQYGDTLWVAAAAPGDEAAAYGAVAALLRGFALVALPVQIQLGSQLATGFARGHFDVRTFVGLVATYLLLAAVPLTICAAWPTTVMQLAYGDAFVEYGAPLLAPLACAAVLVHLGITIASVMIARGRFGFLWGYGAIVLLQSIGVAIAASWSASATAHVTWIGHALAVIVLLIAVIDVARAPTGASGTTG